MSIPLPLPPSASRTHPDEDLITSLRSPPGQTSGGQATEAALSPKKSRLQTHLDKELPLRQIVFPDPVAFRYLEHESCVKVIQRKAKLQGYELFLVEQWACSRQSPTLVVVTFTGDESDSIIAGVLAIPEDEQRWSTKLRTYLKATHQHHARPKETELGELMVTNLSSFPSALTVIPVPDGDIRNHRQHFIANEDLKRLGCSGRTGLTLSEPTEATQGKFQQLYRTSDRIPFLQSVMEMVKLCQVALCLFEKLDYEYVDGLLCDVTETAIGNWWTEVGADHYNFEPTDGILGPTTVSALLGMLMGARNRLSWVGAPVGKDVFDIDCTERGIHSFQRSQKLERTRRLDRQTLFRLHNVTAKAASGEGWGVQKAVKSTVSEIGGKRGELVIGMVGGKDKGGLSTIETLDIDKFIELANGERAKWLWYGKPRRTQVDHGGLVQDLDSIFATKERPSSPPATAAAAAAASTTASAAKRVQSLPLEEEVEMKRRQEGAEGITHVSTNSSLLSGVDGQGDRDALHKLVLKSVAGKVSDARTGFGRIKDAVGGTRKPHTRGLSINSTREDMLGPSARPLGNTNSAMQSDPAMLGRAFTWKTKPEEYLNAIKKGEYSMGPGRSDANLESRDPSSSTQGSHTGRKPLQVSGDMVQATEDTAGEVEENQSVPPVRVSTSHVSTDRLPDSIDLPMQMELSEESGHTAPHRRFSLDDAELSYKHILNETRWPRRTSFADAEEAILVWDEIVDLNSVGGTEADLKALGEVAHQMKRRVDEVVYDVEPWVEEKLKLVGRLDERYQADQQRVEHTYAQLSEDFQRARTQADELLAEERAHLTENVKEIEVLVARLDYEINTLVQKVQDVEDSVQSFERQVDDVERRAAELKMQLETESWLHWIVRKMTGVGTGPNITQSAET